MPRLAKYMDMLSKSVVHAPNLKRMRLTLRNAHRSNAVGREVVVRHVLALRMMNPSADIDFVKLKENGVARVDYELWDGADHGFDIKPKFDADLVVAKVMMAARDPALDDAKA